MKIKKIAAILLCVCMLLTAMLIPASAAETSVTYTFSDYRESAAVTNYSKSLDDTITISLLGETQNGSGYFNAELRVYQGAYATITSAKEISSFVMLAGNKDGTYDISTSTDGTNWTVVVDDAAYTSAYSDHTITLPTAAKYIKLEATKQIRIKTLTVNFVGEATEEPVVPPVEPEVPENNDPAADSTLTIVEANALGASKASNEYTAGKYFVEGVIEAIANTTYGNMYIKDAEDNMLYIHGAYSADGQVRYDAMEVKPVAGDTVKIYGIIGNYNGTAQMKNGWVVAHTVAEEPEVSTDPAAESTLTIVEAIALGTSKLSNVYTEGKYYVVGEITEVYQTTYGNMRIKDAEGNILTIYGTYSADGQVRYDAMEVKPVAGDTVKIYGIIGNYNGTAQIKNGWIVEHTPSETPVEPEEPEVQDPAADSTLTIVEAIALGTSKSSNVYTSGKYYVVGEITEVYQATYGNMRIKDAEGNILTVYGTYSADGQVRYDAMDVQPVAGDTVKVYGIIGNYNGTPQIKNGWIVEHTPATQPEVCTHAYDDDFDAFCNKCDEVREINYPADKVELKEIDGVKYIYVNGRTSVEGLFKVGDDYYCATWGGVVITGDQYVHLSYCDKAAGKHLFFAEDGKMVVKGFETVDGVKKLYIDGRTSVEGLFEVDGKYYLATWGGVVLTDGRYYVTESFAEGIDAGKEFTVDENGAVLDGIVEIDGQKYYYDFGTTVVPGEYEVGGQTVVATWGGLIVE